MDSMDSTDKRNFLYDRKSNAAIVPFDHKLLHESNSGQKSSDNKPIPKEFKKAMDPIEPRPARRQTKFMADRDRTPVTIFRTDGTECYRSYANDKKEEENKRGKKLNSNSDQTSIHSQGLKNNDLKNKERTEGDKDMFRTDSEDTEEGYVWIYNTDHRERKQRDSKPKLSSIDSQSSGKVDDMKSKDRTDDKGKHVRKDEKNVSIKSEKDVGKKPLTRISRTQSQTDEEVKKYITDFRK